MPTSPPGSRDLIDDFRARRFSPPASEVTAAEIERAPRVRHRGRRLPSEVLPRSPALITATAASSAEPPPACQMATTSRVSMP